ncbi:MAG: hypothetical protein I8H87_00650 [Comamonadaceae bacterium]|nr:hypothetical protein [Comamonadaceae bacterium]
MRRLPGISIVDVPPVAGDGLPVMDVPVFVGFAERGPTDRPVALEDPAQYAAVFGGTVELAPAAGSPAPLRAHLPAAVAAFFAGGGRRCYVIRVAGDQADSARFAVAGLRLATRQRVAGAGAGAGPWTLAGSDFTLRANSPGTWAELDQLAVRLSGCALHRGDKVHAGDVLRARLPTPRGQAAADAPTGWLRVDADDLVQKAMPPKEAGDPHDVAPRVWLWTDAAGRQIDARTANALLGLPGDAPCPDPDNWLIDRMSVDLALRHPARPTLRRDSCALAAGGGDLPWFEPDASARFDAASGGSLADSAAATGAATATGDLVSLGWPLAGPTPDKLAHLSTGPDWMLVPAGVDADFGPWQPAQVADADALARMGLADYRAELFLDPDWINGAGADLRGAQLMRWADDIRFLTANPRRLRGLHAALGRDDAVARDATWIAVPDATHTGWTQTKPPPRIDGLLTPTPDPDCTCDDDAPAFSDCVKPPKRPQPPVFTVAPQAPADVQWFIDALALALADEPGSPPDGSSPPDASSPPAGPAVRISYEAQIAHLPDFSDAGPLNAIAGAPDLSPTTDAKGRVIGFAPGARVFAPARYALRLPAGLVFLRARVWRDGLSSDWSQAVEVHAVGVTRIANAGPVDGAAVLFPVHAALMDLCAATREHFGLLSVPQAWKPADLAAHVAQLHARAARDVQAAQATSFVALHHPWLLRREDGDLVAHPPEGALLGVYARRSRDMGAWSAAGLDPLTEAVALATQIDPGAIEDAGGNAIELRPRGIATTRACTLSEDADWSAIGVRRLFILLRRLARREGERYAFEPNNFTLRRSLERSFDGLLQGLMQRGAFRGSRAPDCYLLRTTSGTQALHEIERGECSLEIRVAPSRPLRFLTLRVVRAGEQLTIEER